MTTHQWIADRRPTAKDADKNGAVMILVNDSRGDAGVLTAPWQQVSLGTLWRNTMHNGGDLQFPAHRSPVGGGGGMTGQYRATPEQWAYMHERTEAGLEMTSCIIELRARVEALEATQHAHADVSRLSDAERERLTQELAKPAAWRPLDIETTYGSEAAADAAQILRVPMVVEGTFDHGGETYRYKANATPERDPAMADGGSLLEMVAKAIYNVPHDSAAEASAAICAVATWLDRFALHGSGEYAQAAKVLRQEANHG